MAIPGQQTITQWLQSSLNIPWLVSGTNGTKDTNAWGGAADTLVQTFKDAVTARFPSKAPVDALPHLGGDRQLIQGANESNSSFVLRCKDPWSQWARAGSALSVLEQLAYYGATGAVWVQQNGLSYTLSAPPTAGVDPTPLLVTTATSTLSSTLTSTVPPYRTIPVGTPWFYFDGNTDLCNRFAILFPSWPFSALAVANFANSDSATVTWPFTFASSSYSVIYGPPGDAVTIWNDGTAQTTTGTTLRASAPWTGTVWAIGFAAGVNPLNVFTTASFGTLQKIITTWRPNALCTGVFSILSGRMWDWPANTTWDGYGGNWDSGPSVISTIVQGAF